MEEGLDRRTTTRHGRHARARNLCAHEPANRRTLVGAQLRPRELGTADPVNRALSAANSCLYGICHAGILSMGYSPALGFIHTGKQLSFVYDIADLYKTEISIPLAFAVAEENRPHIGTGDSPALP